MKKVKLLSGFAVINDTVGKRISYTFTEVDEQGNVLRQNVKESYLVLDEEEKKVIDQLEAKIKAKMESTTK